MMSRLLGALLMGVMASAMSYSQPSKASVDGHQMANADFVKQFKAYTAFSALDVKFTQEKTLMELKTPLLSQGSLHVNRGKKLLRWVVTQPSRLVVTIDSKSLTMESGTGSSTQRQVFNLQQMNSDAKAWKDLSIWIDFDPLEISKHYKVSSVGERGFELKPNVIESSPFTSLKIIASAAGYIENMEMIEKSGDVLRLKFSKPKITKQ